jgi:hypothetical protein
MSVGLRSSHVDCQGTIEHRSTQVRSSMKVVLALDFEG